MPGLHEVCTSTVRVGRSPGEANVESVAAKVEGLCAPTVEFHTPKSMKTSLARLDSGASLKIANPLKSDAFAAGNALILHESAFLLEMI